MKNNSKNNIPPNKLPRVKRVRKRVVSEPKTATSTQLDVLEVAEKGVEEIREVVKVVYRSSWLRRILKYGLIFTLFLVVMFGATIGGLAWWIDDEDVEGWIRTAVEQQTGGKLTYSQLSFSVPYGLTIDDPEFYPPLRTDSRGYINGGEVEAIPTLAAESLKVHYSLPALLLLRLNVNAVKLENPTVQLDENERGSSLDGIGRYRAANLPAVGAEPEEPEVDTGPLKISELLPLTPSKVVMPISISLEQMGLENLRLKYRKASFKTKDTIVELGPVSVMTEFHWSGTTSELLVKLFNNDTTKILVDGPQKQEISIDLNNEVRFTNFTELGLFLENNIERLDMPGLNLEGITSLIKLDSEFSPVYNQYKINALDVSLVEALLYRLEGEIGLPNDDLELVRLNIKQNMKIDIFALNQTLNQVLPKSSLYGMLELTHFDIQGDVDLTKLSPEEMTIPYINGNVRLVDVKADLSEMGLLVAPVNGNISLGAGPSMIGEGSQADALIDILLPSIKYAARADGKTYKLEVKDLETKLTTRGMFPNPALPIFKLNVEASHIVAKVDDVETVDVPFELEVDVDVREALSKASADVRIELPRLLEAGIDADCRMKCEELKLAADLDIRSLGKLFGIAQPILQRNVSLKNIPSKLAGGIASKISLRGGIKNLDQVAVDSLIKEGNIDVNMYANINDVDLELPGYGVSLDGFNNRLFMDGSLEKLKMIFRQDFDELRIADESIVKKPVRIENFQFETDLLSEAVGPFNLKNPAANMKTTVNLNLGVAKIEAPGYTPRPINNPRVKIAAYQERMRRVTVDSIKISAPDFGAEIAGDLETALNKQFQPQTLNSKFKVALNHGVGKALPSGVRSSGDAEFRISAISEDMKTLSVAGGLMFDHFSIDVPQVDDPNQTLLKVEDMHGNIPLAQRVDLTAYLDKPEDANDKKEADLTFQQVAEDYFERNRDLLAERENRILELDYGSVRPFFPKKTPLTIKQITFQTLALKRMEMDIELRQNWFAINQFMVQFLDGKIHGGLQFAFDPEPVGVNTSVHLTRLDTRKLIDGFPKLKKKSNNPLSLFSDPYLDATMHLRYNLKNDEIDGGMDITSIGKEQLRMILFYIDPQQSNPTISQIRTALNFGEVSQVSVPIKNGFIGLNVGVNVLSAPIPLPQLRGFPIAQVVKNFKDQPETELPAESENDIEDEELEDDGTDEVELDAEPVVH